MAPINGTTDLYARARGRVEELRGFYIHLVLYVFVNAGLFGIDLMTGDGWWFFWPLFGWGIGLVAHAVSLFFSTSRFATGWEERKIEAYVRDMETDTERRERVSAR